MTNTQRQQLIAKLHKVLKQHYKPIVPNVGRPILEQVLFACCLEDAHYATAEKVFAKLGEGFFDLNEIRVTTVAELAETLAELPDPARAGLALRRVLQSVFESSYSFSLEHAKKHSLAHGLKTLEQLHGVPPFVVSFVASTALGGHAVPLDRGALSVLLLVGAISKEEYDSGKVPWIEKAIAKKVGPEFSSLLHQFGADVVANLHGTNVRKILLAIDPAAKDRLPKRGEPLPPRNPPPPPAGREGKRAADAAEEHRPAGPQAAARPAGKTPVPPTGPSSRAATKSGKPGPKPFVVKPNVGKPLTIKPELASPAAKSEPAKPAMKAKQQQGKSRSSEGKAGASSKRPAAKGGATPSAAKSASGKSGPASGKSGSGKAVGGKSGGKGHSLELAKKKPR